MNLRSLKEHPLIRRCAICLGLTQAERSIVAAAAAKGGEVKFGWFGTSLKMGNHVVLFPADNPFIVRFYVDDLEYFKTRAFFKPSNGLHVADCRGPAEYKLPSGGRIWLPIAAEPIDIFTGYFAQGEPTAGQIVFDVGAYCGETAIEMALKVGPTGRVFAFEPDQKNIFWLEKNIAQSGLKNITVVPKGLWKETTTLEFSADGTSGSSLFKDSETAKPTAVTRIDVLSPADAFALAGRVPDFIKMDIEGAEVEVLEAMSPLIKTAPIRLAIASYHLRGEAKTCDVITPVLSGAGLTVSTGYPKHLTTWAHRA